MKIGWTGDNTCEKKRKSVQKNKVFIFISVLHLGETGSLTKLNLSKGMNFTLQCEVYMYSKTSQGNVNICIFFFKLI
jgi:hypothetical protein